MSKRIGSKKDGIYQRHHDLYVKRKLKGELTDEDLPQYNLAMLRQREGLVKPIAVHIRIGYFLRAFVRDTFGI
jgi:hypothetical protein